MPVTFEPPALDDAMCALLEATGLCDLHLRTPFTGADVDRAGRRVRAVLARNDDGDELRVEATVFIDATAEIHLARDIGCGHTIGPEDHDVYGETSATRGGLVRYRVSPLADGTVSDRATARRLRRERG